MKDRASSTFFLGLFFVILLQNSSFPFVTADDVPVCSTDERCTQLNRECLFDDNYNNSTSCGECLDGFIEYPGGGIADTETSNSKSDNDRIFSSPCLAVDALSWELFESNFDLYYKQDDQILTPVERLVVLLENARFISEHNSNRDGDTSSASAYQLGLTPFSADTGSDYLHRSGYFYVDLTDSIASEELVEYDMPIVAAADLPTSVDWVNAGAVTSVKDQGRCGCCWAVSMAGAVEGAAYIENKYFQSMSFQQFISCNDRNLGCDGGNLAISAVYAVLNDFGGLVRLNDYEYTDYRGQTTEQCDLSTDVTPLAVEINDKPAIVAGINKVMSHEQRVEAFKQALADRPVSMLMKSSCKTLSNYKSGVLTDDGDCQVFSVDDIDHAVLMVGYGVDESSGLSYFKLKNSWGTKWGEDGFFRVADTEKNRYGLFGILSEGYIIANARNVTEEVPDQSQDVPLLPIWAIVLISLAGCCCCITMIGVWRRMRED
mmetsp:Transcript_8127/g.20381  ORF Transcript_8127/g.20381 Transcript_8127/m.20381 type:complete len:489 (+) Transcript_8127:239-1705(+)